MTGCSHCPGEGTNDNGRFDPIFHRILWIADALDFFGDAVNYGISLFVLNMALQARAKAALFKAATMAVFGLWVMCYAVYRAMTDAVPDAMVMGFTGFLALAVNLGVALMLYRYRQGDSNMRSIWLCSRNDALANIAVLLAASGVFLTSTGWPDIVVAAVIAGLNLSAAYHIFQQANGALRWSHQAEAS